MSTKPVYTKCPKCEAKYSYTAMINENTAGVELWSDGFCMAPSRRDVTAFGKCSACNTFFWVAENAIEPQQDLTQIKLLENSWSIDSLGNQEIEVIKDAFRAGLASTTENEILLRIMMWHATNHFIRRYHSQGLFKKIKQKFFDTAEYKNSIKLYEDNISLKMKNLIRLANLLKLDKSENANFLILSEIYRELGDFGKALLFCHKAETSPRADPGRIAILKQHITAKNKSIYRL